MDREAPSMSVARVPPRRTHACMVCKRRKVKCDRNDPCAGCIKQDVECVEAIPAPPRRRKRQAESDIPSRLERCEELLKLDSAKDGSADSPGSDLDGNDTSRTTSAPVEGGKGKLIVDQGESRYVDNTLWTELSEEFRDSLETIHQQKADALKTPAIENSSSNPSRLVFGAGPADQKLSSLHPNPVRIFRLWQAFLENVNPLSKLVHAPTLQAQILEASGDVETLPANMEALLFSIYSTAVCSLSSEDCKSIMGENKPALFRRYLSAAQQALGNLGFIDSSDLVVLQAFVLLLIAMRQNHNPHSLWILSGIALRIGQRMGLHKDGASLGLPVFDAEMRRRVWWQILLLDNRSAQLSGSKNSIVANIFDTRLPANLNDADLNPNMREMPMEHQYPTEMIFCLITYEIGMFVKESGYQKLFAAPKPTAKDKIIEELELRWHTKFLQYCDNSIPLHLLCIAVARSITANMRLLAHHPRKWKSRSTSVSQDERDMLYNLSLEMLENDSFVHSITSLKRFLWHVDVYFQLDAFIFLLSETHRRPPGELTDRAWLQIQAVYNSHRELITDSFALYIAIGNLALRVWEKRQAHLLRLGQARAQAPDFIIALQANRPHQRPEPIAVSEVITEQAAMIQLLQEPYALPEDMQFAANAGTEFAPDVPIDPLSVELSPTDWDHWTNLLEEYEREVGDTNGPQIFH